MIVGQRMPPAHSTPDIRSAVKMGAHISEPISVPKTTPCAQEPAGRRLLRLLL
jgi:hypothetical protein